MEPAEERRSIVRGILSQPDGEVAEVREVGRFPAILSGWCWGAIGRLCCEPAVEIPDWYTQFPPHEYGYRVVGAAASALLLTGKFPRRIDISLVGRGRESAEAFLKLVSKHFGKFCRHPRHTVLSSHDGRRAVRVSRRLLWNDLALLESGGAAMAWDGRKTMAARYQAAAIEHGFVFEEAVYSARRPEILKVWPGAARPLPAQNLPEALQRVVRAKEWLSGDSARVCGTIVAEISPQEALAACAKNMELPSEWAAAASRAGSALAAALVAVSGMEAAAEDLRESLRRGIAVPWEEMRPESLRLERQMLSALFEFEVRHGLLAGFC